MKKGSEKQDVTQAWMKGKSVEVTGKVSGTTAPGQGPNVPPSDRERMEEELERWDGLS